MRAPVEDMKYGGIKRECGTVHLMEGKIKSVYVMGYARS
jgi:hypothetical protein